MEISIRPAKIEECQLLVELQRRASLANPSDYKSIIENPQAIEIATSQILEGNIMVAVLAGEIIGFHEIHIREDGNCELDGLFVEPKFWKNGIARKLVKNAVLLAKHQGAKIMNVIGNPHAEGFYLKEGFVQIGKTQTQFGIGLLMEKKI